MKNTNKDNWIDKLNRFTIISFLMVSSIAMCIGLTACKKKDNTIVIGDDTEIVSPDKGLSINDETMDTLIKQFISGKLDNTADTTWAMASLKLDPADKLSDNIEIIDKYSSRNALYVKIHDLAEDQYYNYRFQMNEENKAESYIKFQLMY